MRSWYLNLWVVGTKGREQAVANKAGIHGQTKEQKAAAHE